MEIRVDGASVVVYFQLADLGYSQQQILIVDMAAVLEG